MKPMLGIVYKAKETDKTYTRWFHEASSFPLLSPSQYLSDRMNLERELIRKNITSDRVMCIVRGK